MFSELSLLLASLVLRTESRASLERLLSEEANELGAGLVGVSFGAVADWLA